MQPKGKLTDDAQRRLSARLVQLIEEAYGADAVFALTIMRMEQHGARRGMAIYTMSTCTNTESMADMFKVAAKNVLGAHQRTLAIEEEPVRKQ